MALEQWNPNIKTPGIRKHTGEYYNPQGFPGGPEGDFIMPNWQAINKSWQAGVNNTLGVMMKYYQTRQLKDEERQAKNDGFEETDYELAGGIEAQNQKILTDNYENNLEWIKKKTGNPNGTFADLSVRDQKKFK